MGGIDVGIVLFNNHANVIAPFKDVEEDQLQNLMIANQLAPIFLTSLLVDKFKARSSEFEQAEGPKLKLRAGLVF